MSTDTFHGWACAGKDQPLEWREFPLKTFEDDDIEMDITHCGICGSDIHTLDSGWGPTEYPCVVGHEIVGVVTKVGKNVKQFKVGDRAGVGAQSGSCQECDNCKNGNENLCQRKVVFTYNDRWTSTNDKTFGGYANKWRGDNRFAFKVPDNMSNEIAATFFCAGVTTFAPLKRYGVTKGSKVGVIGVGGLGHFAIQFAKAMGAEVVALSSSDRKREDAKALGCDDYVVSSDLEGMKKHAGTFTHIICCSFGNNFDWGLFLSSIAFNGHFIMVALPEEPLAGIPAGLLAVRQVTIAGSFIGSPKDIEEMLQFAADTGVKPWINKYSMKEAPAAVQAMRDGKARYRIVLEN
ncbi:nad-and zn-dependent alcohol dehydrogenase [Lichtheimia corymbifera JMRC:FSU:9682]|uniref:Nad-and zn-dependent alcohol dehydrogenase n=1 Tax=Lichtheimia corymbifera JMRC:FSU:9682 TaxID=1263082 RepID=A0A068RZ54_9FUNG|nr:nad-and zn-dependent alcohol dehydrogenase [Lichtheimia corymbifera JMRC:FSU:9682]